MTYMPLTYLQDMEALLAELKLERFVAVRHLARRAGHDAAGGERARSGSPGRCSTISGRSSSRAGLTRIRSYVGRLAELADLAARRAPLAEAQADRYPDWEIDDWLVYAKRLCRLNSNGRIVFDYDMQIAEPFKLPQGEAGFDLWPAFDALDGIPSLVVHGELSDVLSAESVRKMTDAISSLESATVPRVGHAPTLDEPAAQKAIDKLLKRVAGKKA